MSFRNETLYGIGKGEAQVYDPRGVVDNFANLLAKKQAQRQQELKQLADLQGQLKPDGLRNDADRKDFFDQAANWRTKSIAAMNERDPYKRAMAQTEAQKAYMQAQDLVSRSKQQAVKDNAFNTFAMNNATRHQLTDDAIAKGLANTKVGVNHPDIITDYSSLQRAPEYDYLEKIATDFDKKLKGTTIPQRVFGKETLDPYGNKVTPVNNVSEPSKLEQAANYLNVATHDDRAKMAMQGKYPQFFQNLNTDEDLHNALANAANAMANERDLKVVTPVGDAKPDESWSKFKKQWDYKGNHPHSAGDGGTIGVPKDQPIYYNGSQAKVDTKGYVGVNSAPINMVGQQSYNLTTGEKDANPLPSVDVQLVGITNTPFITGDYTKTVGGKKAGSLKGTIAQQPFIDKHPKDIEYRPTLHIQMKNPEDPNGPMIDKLVPTDGIPKNLPKATLKALSGFRPYSPKTAGGTPLENKHKKAATDYGL